MSASGWFYITQGKDKAGPVSSRQLQALAKAGQLSPMDFVWKASMKDWAKAGKIKGLFPRIEAVTTNALHPAPPPPRIVPQQQPGMSTVKILFSGGVLVVCFLVGVFFLARMVNEPMATAEKRAKKIDEDSVKLAAETAERNGLSIPPKKNSNQDASSSQVKTLTQVDTVEQADIPKVAAFPDRYKGKTLELVLWFEQDCMKKSEDFQGLYLAHGSGSRKEYVQAPWYGWKERLKKDSINFLITARQAEFLVDDVGGKEALRCTCIVRLADENIKGKTYLIGRIIEMSTSKGKVR